MISPLAYIHPDAKLGKGVTVEPFAYIAGDAVIGDDCWIGPGAVIHDGARIGKGCKIHTAASVACLPDIYTFIELDKMSSCGNMAQINETTGCDYSYMIWGFSPNINGYYLTSYEGLPTYNNPGERYKTLYLTGFSKR